MWRATACPAPPARQSYTPCLTLASSTHLRTMPNSYPDSNYECALPAMQNRLLLELQGLVDCPGRGPNGLCALFRLLNEAASLDGVQILRIEEHEEV